MPGYAFSTCALTSIVGFAPDRQNVMIPCISFPARGTFIIVYGEFFDKGICKGMVGIWLVTDHMDICQVIGNAEIIIPVFECLTIHGHTG